MRTTSSLSDESSGRCSNFRKAVVTGTKIDLDGDSMLPLDRLPLSFNFDRPSRPQPADPPAADGQVIDLEPDVKALPHVPTSLVGDYRRDLDLVARLRLDWIEPDLLHHQVRLPPPELG